MKRRCIAIITLMSLLFGLTGMYQFSVSAAAATAPAGLLTNELENPLNVETPTFGWLINAEGENVVQTAYRIVMTDEVTGDTVWDSGKVASSEQSYVPYGATAGQEETADGYAVTLQDAVVTGATLTKITALRNENTEAATVIAASYSEGGSLSQVVFSPLEAGNKSTTAEITFNTALIIPEGGSAKAFVWKGDSVGKTMEPISAVFNPIDNNNGADATDNLAEELEEGHPYSWKVKTWTQAGNAAEVESAFSASAYFATGVTDWDGAKWISDGTTGAEKAEGTYNHFWYVRKSDTLDSGKTVKKATAYISGLQDYDLYVNDTEIGRGQSFDYASESRYQGWDITDAVKKDSANITVGALVRTYGGGQGRAAVNAGFLGYINVFYTDGTVKTVKTDNTWKVSKSVPFSGTTKRNGEGDFVENYNAQNAQEGFTLASYNDSAWTAASDRTVDEEITKPIAELSKPTDYIVHPISVTKVADGTTVADFGKVIPARPMITFANGTAGTQLAIQTGYMLKSDGTINTYDSKTVSATQSTDMRFIYTQKAGTQVYNAWDHLGFRYLSIPSCGEDFTTETIAAKVVHTNVPEGRDSTFVSSNETLNNVYELMKRSSIYGIQNEFVDTPTREKGQFTDDSRNISEASMATQFERETSRKGIMQFLASADRYWTTDGKIDGRYNSVYPNVDGKRDIPEYSVNIPQWIWNYYMQTGDKATLEYAYPYMKATADYISDNISATTGLVEKLAGGDGSPNAYQYGIVDWPDSGRFGYDWSGTKNGARTTINMLSKNAFDVVALAAAELGNDEDKTDMESRSAALKTAINNGLVNDDGLYVDGTNGSSKVSHVSQHANSFALAFNVVPEADKGKVAEYVAGMGMRQGPMTADILAKGLFNGGQDTAALKLFINENDYGWANTIKQGGSFTWESWVADGLTSTDSQSHAWGATAASDILRNFAGVKVTEPGARRVSIAPVYVDLKSLNATVQTERGGVGVKYERDDTKYEITLTIPANMTADVTLPNVGEGTYKRNGVAVENTFTLGSGTYTYVFDGTVNLPEAIDLKDYDTEEYDFKTLPSDANGDYKYNDMITLHFGAYGGVSGADGFNMYKDSTDNAYLIFTPLYDGEISITGKVRGNASTLYVSENVDTAKTAGTTGATQLRGTGKDSATAGMGSMNVKAGKTYYLYNTGGSSTSNPTSITTITYTHERVPLEGIKGTDDAESKTYSYKIGSGTAGNSYSDTSDIIDLTVSLGNGDSMSEMDGTIKLAGSSVGESDSVNSSKRYLLVTPKKSGTFSMDIAFSSASSSKKNRVYYRDLGTEPEIDLTQYKKADPYMTLASGSETTTAVQTRTLDMTAGHTYILYTYQTASVISALSYAYTDTEIEVTPDGLNKKYMHISFDDVYACLKDITDNKDTYTSVFDNSFFSDLKSLHDTYGAVFTLNCFIKTTKDNTYDISNLPDKYAAELTANADWLKFAFHAQDDNAIYGATTGTSSGTLATVSEAQASYKKFTDAIMAATGNNKSSIDTVTRLGFFSGNAENVKALSECDYGITGLLTADDSRISYYFDTALNSHINNYGYHYDADKKLKLIKTITRLEGNKEVSSFTTSALDNFSGNMIEVFTHESEYLDKAAVRTNLENAVKWAADKNYGFGYAMNLILPPDEQQEIVPNITYEAPEAAKTVTEPSGESITLSRDTYPLVVGNSSKTDFSRWEDQGSSFALTAAVDSTDYTADNITWTVDDEDIAYIRDNKTSGASTSIRGKRTGSTRAVASLPNNEKAVCYITVIDNVTRVTTQTLELNADTLALHTGDIATLIPIINPKDVFGNGVLNTDIGWASENNNVVTVNDGVVTAVAPGTAKIMAKSDDVGRRAYCTVTVTDGTASAGANSTQPETAMTVGETAQLTAAGTDLTWKSDNPAVADVDSTGKVTAYSNSNVPHVDETTNKTVFENGITKYDESAINIYATAQDGSVTTFPVKVSDAERKAESVSIYMADTNVAAGGTADITAAVLPAYAFSENVTWESSNPSVATVTGSGRTVYGVPKATITGVAAGSATITAKCGNISDTVAITVTTQKDEVTVTTDDVKYQMEVDAVYDRLFAVTPKANSGITFETSNSSIVTVDNEGVIRGVKPGTVTITARLGDAVKATREVEVVENDPTLRYLHAPAEARTDSSINLLWTRASLLDTGDFASYSVYKSTDGITYDTTLVAEGITTLGYTVEGLNPDTQYHFKVVAVDSKGDEIASSTTVARTKAESTVIDVTASPYNATGDGVHMDTYAIQKAIDEAGYGDTILLPEGKIFLSGALYLKSNITFKVDGILLGSPYDKDYPATITRWEGWRRLYQTAEQWGANSGTDGLTENVHPHASLINAGTYDEGTPSYTGAYNIENLTICGKGMINANGFRLGYNEGLNQKSPQPEPMTPAMNQTVRGRAITLHNADKVYIKDVTVSYSPSWTIHPIFCRNLTVDGVKVVSAGDGKTGAADDITILNGDGIDPDSSTMVNLFNMDFQTGDDGVAIKTGKDKEGNTLDKPCAYIRVTDCYSHDSKGGIVIGSENASGTHDTLIQNVKVGKTTLNHTIWLKGCWSRGGVTHDLVIRDIDGVDKFDIQTTYNTPTNNPADTVPQYKNITFENCNVSFTAKGFNHSISGLSDLAKTRPETYLESFTIRGCPKGGTVDYAKNFTIIDPEKESNWSFGSHTENMSFIYSDSETSTKLKLTDSATCVSSVDNDNHTITAATGTTEDELLAELVSLVNANITKVLSSDGKTLTVTAQDGTTIVEYTVSYAKVWNFSKYTTEVKTTESGFTESYDGLTIAIANNGGDSDHDKITTAGVYWRGGASSGNSTRYIQYTPTEDGTLTVTGKLNGSGGRLGISTSLDVGSLAADASSTTSTSTATFSMNCTANTTYYIIPKGKSATVSKLEYIPD